MRSERSTVLTAVKEARSTRLQVWSRAYLAVGGGQEPQLLLEIDEPSRRSTRKGKKPNGAVTRYQEMVDLGYLLPHHGASGGGLSYVYGSSARRTQMTLTNAELGDRMKNQRFKRGLDHSYLDEFVDLGDVWIGRHNNLVCVVEEGMPPNIERFPTLTGRTMVHWAAHRHLNELVKDYS